MLGVFRALLRAVSGTNGRLTAELDALEGMSSRDVPILQHYGFSSSPLAGADVIVVQLGKSTQRVIMAEGDRRYSVTLEPGQVALHTAAAEIRLSPDGVIKISGTAIVVDGPDVRLGNGLHEALLKAGFLTSYNAHTHTLGMVPTSPPVVQETGNTTQNVRGS